MPDRYELQLYHNGKMIRRVTRDKLMSIKHIGDDCIDRKGFTGAAAFDNGEFVQGASRGEYDRTYVPRPTVSKLDTLVQIEGFESREALLEHYIIDSVCPGICINEGCSNSKEVEPDSGSGWCEECEMNTVASAMRLAGVI